MLILCICVIIKLIYLYLAVASCMVETVASSLCNTWSPLFELPEQLCHESCCKCLWSVVVIIPLPQCKSDSYHIGIFGRIASRCFQRPLVLPEIFNGEAVNWDEWIDHFKSVVVGRRMPTN